MIKKPGERRAATAASTLATISSAPISCLPSMCPHFFGITWSSMCTAATPAASYSWTVRITLIGLP